MRKFLTFLPLLLLVLSGCISEREYVVEHDYSYKGKFQKYKTFDFLEIATGMDTYGDSVIRTEIHKKLVAQGYKISEKPSLLIAFKVFGGDMKFLGYKQMDLVNWTDRYGYIDDVETDDEALKQARYDKHSYQLSGGTLLIDFIDSRTHSVIWQGYASGLYSDKTFFSKDTKYAVRTILNQYKMLAYEQSQLN